MNTAHLPKTLLVLIALIAINSPAVAVQHLGEIPTCRGTIQQVFLRTPGASSYARWKITSGNPAVALFSLSPSGPFAAEINFLVIYGSSGAEVSTFYVQGTSSGLSLMTADPDDKLQGRDTYTADMLVDRVTSVELVDMNDQTLDTNPANGGGLRIFTDVPLAEVQQFTPVDSQQFDVARTVRAKVRLEGQNNRFPVHVRVFDVDDPEDQSVEIDPNGTAGDDNIGTNGGPKALRGSSGSDGEARIPVLLSTQPGDNFRIAAACEKPWLDGLVVSGTDVREANGQMPDIAKGRVSDMVTAWRYLHLEVETMGPVQCNQLRGTVAALKHVQGGKTQIKLSDVTDNCNNPFSLKQDTKGGEFVDGALGIAGATYTVVDSRAETITVVGLVPTAAAGSTAVLVDDDNVGGGPLNGDEDDPVPPPDLGLLQNSSDKAANMLAAAYVVPVADLTTGLFPAIQLNTPAGDPTVIYQYGWQAHDNDPMFWTGYVLGAYQGPTSRDDDPEAAKADAPFLGLTDLANTGSMVFAESIRDATRRFAPNPIPPGCRPDGVTAHEVVHLFDAGTVHLKDFNGLMSADCITADDTNGQLFLADATIRMIRSAKHP